MKSTIAFIVIIAILGGTMMLPPNVKAMLTVQSPPEVRVDTVYLVSPGPQCRSWVFAVRQDSIFAEVHCQKKP